MLPEIPGWVASDNVVLTSPFPQVRLIKHPSAGAFARQIWNELLSEGKPATFFMMMSQTDKAGIATHGTLKDELKEPGHNQQTNEKNDPDYP